MLTYVIVALSFSLLPPLVSSKHICSSSFFESTTDDPKIVLNFFLGGEVISSGLN
jgi:hypothetical protein